MKNYPYFTKTLIEEQNTDGKCYNYLPALKMYSISWWNREHVPIDQESFGHVPPLHWYVPLIPSQMEWVILYIRGLRYSHRLKPKEFSSENLLHTHIPIRKSSYLGLFYCPSHFLHKILNVTQYIHTSKAYWLKLRMRMFWNFGKIFED